MASSHPNYDSPLTYLPNPSYSPRLSDSNSSSSLSPIDAGSPLHLTSHPDTDPMFDSSHYYQPDAMDPWASHKLQYIQDQDRLKNLSSQMAASQYQNQHVIPIHQVKHEIPTYHFSSSYDNVPMPASPSQSALSSSPGLMYYSPPMTDIDLHNSYGAHHEYNNMDIQAPIPAYSPVTSPQQVGCDPRAIYTQPEQPPAANEYNFSSVFTPSSDVDQSQSPGFEDGSGESEKTDSDDGEFPAPRGRSRPVVVPSQVTSTEEPSGDFRPPRTSRLSAPIPVPNLTKKSRGRRVPTTSVVLQNGVTKNARMYMCSVAGCGKVCSYSLPTRPYC